VDRVPSFGEPQTNGRVHPCAFMALTKSSRRSAVEEYFRRVPPHYRAALQDLRETIRAAVPSASEGISWGMPTFRQNGIIVYYAAFADHCSLFLPSALIRRKFSDELRPFQAGKATFRFTPERPLPVPLVTRIVQARLAELQERGPG